MRSHSNTLDQLTKDAETYYLALDLSLRVMRTPPPLPEPYAQFIGAIASHLLAETDEEERIETFGPNYTVELVLESLSEYEDALLTAIAKQMLLLSEKPRHIWRIRAIHRSFPTSRCIPVEEPTEWLPDYAQLRHAGTSHTRFCVSFDRLQSVATTRLAELLAGERTHLDYSHRFCEWSLLAPHQPVPVLFPCIV